MSRSITIATVTAPKFVEFPESPYPRSLTPRLHLKLNYDDGTRSRPRAYTLTVFYDRLSDDGYQSVILHEHRTPVAVIEVANRFSQSKLEKLLAAVHAGKYNETIDELYDNAVKQLPQHHWPMSIMPKSQSTLIPDGCVSEELAT